jgi:hypothetical protein
VEIPLGAMEQSGSKLLQEKLEVLNYPDFQRWTGA